jgi:chromo domain-containing protein 1
MDLYFLLHDTGYCNGVDPDAPFLQLPPAYWPIISERPVIFEEYFTALQQSQNTANRFLVSHYADWMLSDYRNYRHLIIVHPHPEGWEDEIPLIDEVMTPQKCMEHFEQPAIDNRFDFWEWAYDPLEEAQES